MNFDRALQAEINKHCDQSEMESWDIYDRSPSQNKEPVFGSGQWLTVQAGYEKLKKIIDSDSDIKEALRDHIAYVANGFQQFTKVENEVLLDLLRENQDTLSQQLRANLTAKINNLTNYAEQTNGNE